MSAKTLSLEDAKAARIQLLDDESKGGQAVHDLIVAYQANRRSGTANTKTPTMPMIQDGGFARPVLQCLFRTPNVKCRRVLPVPS